MQLFHYYGWMGYWQWPMTHWPISMVRSLTGVDAVDVLLTQTHCVLQNWPDVIASSSQIDSRLSKRPTSFTISRPWHFPWKYCEIGPLFREKITLLYSGYGCEIVLVLVLVLEADELGSRNFHAPISVQCLSSLFLNALVDGASTTCCSNAFQLLITRMLKKDFRAVVEHRGTNNFFECPRKQWVSVANWSHFTSRRVRSSYGCGGRGFSRHHVQVTLDVTQSSVKRVLPVATIKACTLHAKKSRLSPKPEVNSWMSL